MDAFEIKDRRLASVEELATGFRWLEAGSNLAFGGPMKNRLFILASHTLYAVFLNRRGVQWP